LPMAGQTAISTPSCHGITSAERPQLPAYTESGILYLDSSKENAFGNDAAAQTFARTLETQRSVVALAEARRKGNDTTQGRRTQSRSEGCRQVNAIPKPFPPRHGSYDEIASEYYDPLRHLTCASLRELSAAYLAPRIELPSGAAKRLIEVGVGQSLLAPFWRVAG
ncbi:hypothetical protein NKH60_33650, partial [Mesorhizobium sp. M1006]|uniref:hypothetical protein n=1 Tax=Mesorhizobium sp. M1006 TaxID=2957048 RepID=UPI003334C62F